MEKRLKICRILHWCSVVICFAAVILPMLFWNRIPDTIPFHFGSDGRADSWSDKSSMILLIFFALIMLGAMCLVEYYMRSNIRSEHTDKAEKGNLAYIYPMIVVMDLALQLMIAYMMFCAATARDLGVWFLPVVLTAVFGPMLYYIPKSMRLSGNNPEKKGYYCEKELAQQGEVYRSKVDWWLGIILAACIIFPIGIFIHEWMREGKTDWVLLMTEVFILAIMIPLFRTKYILYPDHLVVVCIGKERIDYHNITGMKETHNPLSSAALSLDRLQIDYKNDKGGHNIALISPVKKREFMDKINRKRELYKE